MEYMFIFSKGKPTTFNPIKDRKNITTTGSVGQNSSRKVDGSMGYLPHATNTEFGMRHNIWRINTAGQENMGKELPHPAMFPNQLAQDHIISWSNEGDLVFDPFVGSGTTLKMAKLNNRKSIGVDISEEYCQIAKERCSQEVMELSI
jgi:site-specific DNA-methyltransferase (adenine-specific)